MIRRLPLFITLTLLTVLLFEMAESAKFRALWQGKVIAEADSSSTVSLEGNTYFPLDSVNKDYIRDSTTTTKCGWKGTANYYDVIVDGNVNKDAAWYYADPKSAASEIKGMVAFWKGVKVSGGGQEL